jgi:hypothetical protein
MEDQHKLAIALCAVAAGLLMSLGGYLYNMKREKKEEQKQKKLEKLYNEANSSLRKIVEVEKEIEELEKQKRIDDEVRRIQNENIKVWNKNAKRQIDEMLAPHLKEMNARLDVVESDLNEARSDLNKAQQLANLGIQAAQQTIDDGKKLREISSAFDEYLDTQKENMEDIDNEEDPEVRNALIDVQQNTLKGVTEMIDDLTKPNNKIDIQAEADKILGVPNSLKVDWRLSRQGSNIGPDVSL